MSKLVIRTSTAAACSAALLGAALSAPAHADGVGTQACVDMGWHYDAYSKQDLHIPSGTHWKSGPGGTVSASKEYSQAASMSVSIGVSVSYSAIVAEAEASYGIDASTSSSRSETYTYSRNISSNSKYGHLQFGNWGWRMGVDKYYVNSVCRVTSEYTGTVNKMPSANTWGYRYWETTS